MNVANILECPKREWKKAAPASTQTIEEFVTSVGFILPPEYIEFLHHSNGGEGILAVTPWYFAVFPAEDVLQANLDYDIPAFLPCFFAFGSSLGGEILLFSKHEEEQSKVYIVPATSLCEEDIRVSTSSFLDFVKSIGLQSELAV